MILMPMLTAGEAPPGAPSVVPSDVEVDPGEEFELKVSVTANVNSTHRVTFTERDRFSFPSEKYQEHNMTKGDAILFKVSCKVASDAPDGDFNLTYQVTWEFNGTPYELSDTIRVTIGEGADKDSDSNDNPCGSALIIAGVSVLAFSVVLINQRKRR